MLQWNRTKNDVSTFFMLNIDCFIVRNWVLPYMKQNAKRSAVSILILYIHFHLSFPDTSGAKNTNVDWKENSKVSSEFL